MRLNLRRPAPGAILGFLALSVALAGNAGALPGKNVVKKGDIAKGAVTTKTLARSAVRSKALAKGAVISDVLGANSVTPNAIAPSAVRGYALGDIAMHTAPIADPDTTPADPTWTSSSTQIASCGVGERLLSGGVLFTNPGNRMVGVLQSVPANNAWVGQITSDSGGSAAAEVQVLCLK